jgi:hypothetical protein
MPDTGAPRDDLAAAFEDAFARLRVRVEMACAGEQDAPVGVALGIRAAFGFAAEHPPAARLLTSEALTAGDEGQARYARMVTHFAALLRAAREPGPAADASPIAEDALVGGIALLVARRLACGREDELSAAASDATRLVLTPWVGIERARQIAAEHC